MFKEYDLQRKNGTSAAITVKDWLILMAMSLLSIIPVVGTIIFLVLYIMIAFKQDSAVSIASYIKANLIVSAIVFVVVFLVMMVAGASITALLG